MRQKAVLPERRINLTHGLASVPLQGSPLIPVAGSFMVAASLPQ